VNGRYALLNRGANKTILFCPGAGGNCIMLSWLQQFAMEHPEIAFITIVRWPRTNLSIRDASYLLDQLTSYTIDLLDTLHIDQVTVVSHSAGVYQQLHLAQEHPGRVKSLDFIATHIPAAYLASRTVSVLPRLPESVFNLIKIVDSKGISWLNRLGLRGSVWNPHQFYSIHLGSASIDKLVDQNMLDNVNDAARLDARDKDYALSWQRLEGMDEQTLANLYKKCRAPVIWYTSPSDVYFGPEAVERIRAEMSQTTVDVRHVDQARHANIYRRIDIWQEIISQV
jgi:pimeloyl-ACP methyl ester carboxylesterase